MSTQNSEYAIVIDESYDAVLLRDLLQDAAQKHHTRARAAVSGAIRKRNMDKYAVFVKYAARCEHIRLEEVERMKAGMGPSV